MKAIVFFFLLCCCAFTSYAQTTLSETWVSDQGNGQYKNPVLHADYSDPDAVRVGDYYYMTASSFNCTPGLPVLKSADLVNWQLIGYALPRQVPLEHFNEVRNGEGVWAPAIRYHKGLFYIYYPDPDFGIYVVTAKQAEGPWSAPELVLPGKGIIDPCPLWDDDGKAYLIYGWAASRAQVNSLLTISPLTADGKKVTGDGRHVFDGHDAHPTLEGPKFYKRNRYYYIFAPAGGVATGWQLVLRSKNIYGPYEEKIVMDQGRSPVNGPHQGAWVETPSGESWFLHFQDKGVYGRVVHLQPMSWKNNWPVIGADADGDGKGEPVLLYKKPVSKINTTYTPPESDEFNTAQLGLQWQWNANPQITWWAQLPPSGYLRLFALRRPAGSINMWQVPNLLLQKFPAPAFTVTTKLRLTADSNGKQAGLLVMGLDYGYISIRRSGNGYLLSQMLCKDAEKGQAETKQAEHFINVGWVWLRVQVKEGGDCLFSYSEDGTTFAPLGNVFKAREGKWIGARVGIFCNGPAEARNGGYADFDWFHVEP